MPLYVTWERIEYQVIWGTPLLDSLFCIEKREEGEELLASHLTVGMGHVPWGQGSSEGPLIPWKDPEKPEISW